MRNWTSCIPEKGKPGPNHKFVYDIHSTALIKYVQYEPFSLERIFVSGQEIVLVGTDTRQLVAVKYNSADGPAFQLLNGAQAQKWTQRIEISAGTIGYGTNLKDVIYLKPKQFKPVRFGPVTGLPWSKKVKQNVYSCSNKSAIPLSAIRCPKAATTNSPGFARLESATATTGRAPRLTRRLDRGRLSTALFGLRKHSTMARETQELGDWIFRYRAAPIPNLFSIRDGGLVGNGNASRARDGVAGTGKPRRIPDQWWRSLTIRSG